MTQTFLLGESKSNMLATCIQKEVLASKVKYLFTFLSGCHSFYHKMAQSQSPGSSYYIFVH